MKTCGQGPPERGVTTPGNASLLDSLNVKGINILDSKVVQKPRNGHREREGKGGKGRERVRARGEGEGEEEREVGRDHKERGRGRGRRSKGRRRSPVSKVETSSNLSHELDVLSRNHCSFRCIPNHERVCSVCISILRGWWRVMLFVLPHFPVHSYS